MLTQQLEWTCPFLVHAYRQIAPHKLNGEDKLLFYTSWLVQLQRYKTFKFDTVSKIWLFPDTRQQMLLPFTSYCNEWLTQLKTMNWIVFKKWWTQIKLWTNLLHTYKVMYMHLSLYMYKCCYHSQAIATNDSHNLNWIGSTTNNSHIIISKPLFLLNTYMYMCII